MKGGKKFFLFGGIALIFLVAILFFYFYNQPKLLEVDFLNIGQGDAELIKTPFGQKILIDGGPDRKVLQELGNNLSWLNRKIDLVILTHPHDDHFGGLIDVLARYQVGKVLTDGTDGTSPLYESWQEAIKKEKVNTIEIKNNQKIILGPNCYLEIWPPIKIDKNPNNNSLVAKLDCEKKTFLFTGDAEKEEEADLLSQKIDFKADVLKVGHHGSLTATSDDFLKLINPKFAIIEVGAGNKFNLPKQATIYKLIKVGAQVFRTDVDGEIRIIIDKGRISVKRQ